MEESRLIRFLKGECTLEEEQEVLLWLESPESKSQLDNIIHRYWEVPSPSLKDKTDYKELLNRIHSKALQPNRHNEKKWKKILLNSMRMASSILIFLFCTYFLIESFRYKPPEVSTGADLMVLTTTRVTGPGEKLTLTMPDKSSIIVNALSEISFTSDYGKNDRIIQLKGEAYFMIAKDSLLPFKVKTNGFTTTALGTEFNVLARDNQYVIALTEGKVKVGASDKEMELVPGQLALWESEKSNPDFLVQQFDPEKVVGWTKGLLKFERKPLRLILNDLANWYGVEIEIAEEIDTNRRVIGTFQNKNLKDILTGLGFSTGFDFEIKGKHVHLKKHMPMK